MQGVMVVPGRRGLGHIRGIGRMGETTQDLDHVMTYDELQQMSYDFKTVDQALECWKFFARSVALRTKMEYMTALWSRIQADPNILSWLNSTKDGQDWLVGLLATKDAFVKMNQPNLTQTMKLILTNLEVNILPKNFGQAVKGRMPIYDPSRSKELSYADFNTSGAGNITNIFDAGDFSTTSVKKDVDVIMDSKKSLSALDAKLGALAAGAVIAIIVIAGLLAGWIMVLVTIKMFSKDVPESADIQPAPPAPVGMDKGIWQRTWMDAQLEMQRKNKEIELELARSKGGILGKAESFITTLTIGVVAIGVVGTTVYLLARD